MGLVLNSAVSIILSPYEESFDLLTFLFPDFYFELFLSFDLYLTLVFPLLFENEIFKLLLILLVDLSLIAEAF
jgi:hypothetical protein